MPYKVVEGKRQQGSTAFLAPKGRHSQKPEEMRRMIEKVSYPPFIELFARERVEGWDAWGNEVQSGNGLEGARADNGAEAEKDFRGNGNT